MAKPTWYYHVWSLPGGKEGWVYAIGNPLLWWIAGAVVVGALLAMPLRWLWALRAGWEHPLRHAGTLSARGQAIVVSALLPAFAYAGFFLVDRATFLFYMALVVPLLCLPLAGLLDELWHRALPHRMLVAAILGAIVLGFVVYYPVAATVPLTCERYLEIMDILPYMKHEACFQA